MLTFGQELYSLSERDLQTVQLEPFAPSKVTVPFGVGNSTVTVTWPLPLDRNLYLDLVNGFIDGGAAACRIVEVNVQYTPVTGFSGAVRLFTERSSNGMSNSPTPTQFYGVNSRPKLVLPRGGAIELRVVRSDTTLAGGCEVTPFGWLIPAGNLARGS